MKERGQRQLCSRDCSLDRRNPIGNCRPIQSRCGYRPILSANISLFYEISKINVQSFFLIQLFVQFFIILVQQSNVSSNEKYTYALQMEVIIKVRCKAKTRRSHCETVKVTSDRQSSTRNLYIYDRFLIEARGSLLK